MQLHDLRSGTFLMSPGVQAKKKLHNDWVKAVKFNRQEQRGENKTKCAAYFQGDRK